MSDGARAAVNAEYKDRLFNFIFGREENREWTLSLYNAVNDSDYTDASEIVFNTLEDVLYLGMRNDTSFLVSEVMSVYEHQSTYNPNMPLRMMGYVDELYSGYLSANKLNKYSSMLIKLPVPRLVVFYNGIKDVDDEVLLKLSDSFDEGHRLEADIEVRVRMLNVNRGRNKSLMEKCRPLEEYAWFIERIREGRKKHELEVCVRDAVKAMPEDFLLKKFLTTHMKEVEGMLDREYNEEEVHELFKEEGRKEGIKEGRKEGIKEGIKEGRKEGKGIRDQEMISDMLNRGKSVKEIVDFCGYSAELVEQVEKKMLVAAD